MSFNGSGTFLINTAGQPVVAGTVISSTAFNALTADLATGLSTVITKDGQTTVTANIPMSTYKFTGLGVGSAATDSANLSQVQSTVTKLLTSVSGADTITAVGAPVVAAYAAGQMFYFVATGDNTGAVTLNIDSLGAKAVTRDGSVALAAGDIKSGEVVVVVYDGTRFQVVSQLNSAGNATFANVSITSALNVGGVATFSAGTAAAPSITTTGDTNTGIFFPAADTIAFTEGGVEAMRINSSANVGIGATTPSNTAGFSRQLQIEGTTAALTLSGTTGTGKYTLGVPGANAVGLWDNTASAYRWYVDSSGNLGIGTSSPITKLDVRSDAAVVTVSGYSSLHFNALPASATARAATIRKNYDSPFDFNIYASTGTSGNSAATIFYRDITNESMRLDSSGNLFVGGTNGNARLTVRGSGTTSATASIEGATSGGASRFLVSDDGLCRWYGTSNAETMRLDNAGNLGIGTSSPISGSGLTIGNDGNGSATVKLAFSTSSTERASVQMNGAGGEMRLTAGYAGYGGFMTFFANGSERASITGAGNFCAGAQSALATNATDGFLYVPTCAGTPTGTPTAITGLAPIVVNTTNNKLYFYSSGVWRDAGP
jgi:hypothetical protein